MPVFTTAIRCFEVVAREGAIRRAADRLHLSPSAVNRQILHLEEDLGVALFERLPRGMRLSAAGEVLLVSIARQQRELQGALQQFKELRGLGRGHITLTGLSYFMPVFLPEFLAGFRARHPGISFTLLAGNSADVYGHLLDGIADFGICHAPSRGVPLTRMRSFELRFGAVMAPGHPLAGRKKLRFAECMQHPLLLPAPGMEARNQADALGLARWPDRVVAVESNSFHTLVELAKAGVGLAFLVELDAAIEVRRGNLVFQPLVEAASSETLCTLVKTGRTLSPAAATLMEDLGEALQVWTQQIVI